MKKKKRKGCAYFYTGTIALLQANSTHTPLMNQCLLYLANSKILFIICFPHFFLCGMTWRIRKFGQNCARMRIFGSIISRVGFLSLTTDWHILISTTSTIIWYHICVMVIFVFRSGQFLVKSRTEKWLYKKTTKISDFTMKTKKKKKRCTYF